MQGREENVLFKSTGVRLDALQNARVEGMQKIAVAQEKAKNFRATLENPARLGVGAKFEAAYGRENARARFLADVRTGVQDARDGSDPDTGGARNVANGFLAWNCFHDNLHLTRAGSAIARTARREPCLYKSSTPRQAGISLLRFFRKDATLGESSHA
jgi:hypothetical protein